MIILFFNFFYYLVFIVKRFEEGFMEVFLNEREGKGKEKRGMSGCVYHCMCAYEHIVYIIVILLYNDIHILLCIISICTCA